MFEYKYKQDQQIRCELAFRGKIRNKDRGIDEIFEKKIDQ